MKLDTEKIKVLQARNGLNTNQLASKSEITRQWLSIVINRGYANANIVHKIAKGLNVDVTEIIKID